MFLKKCFPICLFNILYCKQTLTNIVYRRKTQNVKKPAVYKSTIYKYNIYVTFGPDGWGPFRNKTAPCGRVAYSSTTIRMPCYFSIYQFYNNIKPNTVKKDFYDITRGGGEKRVSIFKLVQNSE